MSEQDEKLPQVLPKRFSVDSLLKCVWDCLPIDDEIEVWIALADKPYDVYFYMPNAISMLVDARP